MAPTLKDSSADPSPSHSSRSDAKGSQPVALEVPVTVNGARAIPGSDKREPFSENTSTVMVHSNGAVIRLASAVQPGQLLFLTNEKTHKEVVCQVVKSKGDRSSGYVELQFTEPISGFWGLRFPNEKSAQIAPTGAARTSALSQKPSSPSPVPEKSSASQAPEKPAIAKEFKTEIKPEARHLSKADLLAPSESSTPAAKLDSSPLQEQLAALLAMDSITDEPSSPKPAAPLDTAEVAAQLLEIADSTSAASTPPPIVSATVEDPEFEQEPAAPVVIPPPVDLPSATKPKSTFDDDEVKIPAWLQPLARNESVPPPHSSEEETLSPTPDSAAPRPEASTPVKRHEPALKTASSAAVFGNSLLGETPSVPARSSSTSSKGLWIGAIAAVLVLGAGAAWYFRDILFANQTATPKQQVSTSPAPAAAPAPGSGSVVSPSTPSVQSASLDSPSEPSKSRSGPDAPSSSLAQPKLETAAISERIPRTPPAEGKASANESAGDHIFVVEPEKRASLGNVRLKKPKVGHASESDLNAELEPSLEGTQPALSGDSMNSGLIAANKEPSAPAPRIEMGGEVKVARMVSSVAPVYPALAKAQHISGEVRVDALIDATGRVTTMKVVSGPTLLHQAAMDALRQWKYQPATLDGKAVPMHLTVTIQFRLQ